jgi:hypothetical protein
VKKEVGKVGEDSPLFIVPLDSAENKSNIANFFSKSTVPSKRESKPEDEGIDGSTRSDLKSETQMPAKRKIEEIALEKESLKQESSPAKVRIVESRTKVQSPIKTSERKSKKPASSASQKTPVKMGNAKITNFFSPT